MENNRRTIRLPNYDYSSPGLYFITICTENKKCLFGSVQSDEMVLNDKGLMVERWWSELKNKFQNIELLEYKVMPNHIHGIIEIKNEVGADLRVCPENEDLNQFNEGEHIGSPLPVMVQWFKTMSTNEYIRNVENLNWPRFDKRLWQRNYFEHIIRNEKSYNKIVNYIIDNPKMWGKDRYFAESGI